MAFFGFPFLSIFVRVVLATAVYKALVIIYRLTFHPLAKFPGPKLAAATNLYAMCYDLPSTTSYVKQLPALHDKYGPIVRAWPNMLHIRDMDSYNQIYRPGTKFDKDPAFYQASIAQESLFNIHGTKEAMQRKAMYQPFFSKAAIRNAEHLIQEKVSKFLDILRAASCNKTVVDLNLGYSCLTADVIMHYAYHKPLGALDAPDFKFPLIMAVEDFFHTAPFVWYFPWFFHWVTSLVTSLPNDFLIEHGGGVGATLWVQKQCRERVLELKARPKSEKGSLPTIFDTVLDPDPAKGQYTPNDEGLQNDAVLMFIAGTDTTANALVQGTWAILNNPRIHEKLRTEIFKVMPEKNMPANWATLEDLPYLRAVIKESLRFSYGVPGKIPRVAPSTGAIMCGQSIPPGTSVGHSAYVYHTNEDYFENALLFNPDRWLGHDFNELDGRMISFSRGSRSCLGMNLAYAELYLAFAQLFRNFELSVHDTTAKDVDWEDCFTPMTNGHLKVTLKEIAE